MILDKILYYICEVPINHIAFDIRITNNYYFQRNYPALRWAASTNARPPSLGAPATALTAVNWPPTTARALTGTSVWNGASVIRFARIWTAGTSVPVHQDMHLRRKIGVMP